MTSTEKSEQNIHKKMAELSKSCIVEIGVLIGYTTKILLDNSPPQVQIYGIDPIVPDSMDKNLIGDEQKIINLVKEYPKKFTFIKDYSYNVAKTWNERTEIDYIFIDGDHNYTAVKKDFEDWFPFIKKGGYIGLHDSRMNRKIPPVAPFHTGPSKLADELIINSRVELTDEFFSLSLFRKK
jgi:predicted O-methyltransferase YrrM